MCPIVAMSAGRVLIALDRCQDRFYGPRTRHARPPPNPCTSRRRCRACAWCSAREARRASTSRRRARISPRARCGRSCRGRRRTTSRPRGIVSCANQPPLAKSKKSTHALALRFMYAGSMTLSGGSAFCAEAGADAAARATADRIAEPTWRQRGFGFIVRCGGIWWALVERSPRPGGGQTPAAGRQRTTVRL